jgi:RNA polymerase sigma-70 factor (ECF subfamily)
MLKSLKINEDIKKYQFVNADAYANVPDADIIKRVLSGQKQLFEVLMRRYNQRLYRVQRSYLSDEESIKDTLQTTYIKVFENLSSFRGDALFSTWITRIAINEALKYLNKKNRISKLHLIEEKRLMNEDKKQLFDTPEEEAIQNDYKKLLENLVEELPPKYRCVYIMREIENMDTKETSECLDITESNVKVRLHRAKQMISELLNHNLSDIEIFDFLGPRCDVIVYSVMKEIENY